MQIEEPIVVLGVPRSGTSLSMGVLHACGAWVGDCDSPVPDARNPKGFFENSGILRFWKHIEGRSPGEMREAIHEKIISQGYEGGPWAVKCMKQVAIFAGFDPMYIAVQRAPKMILRSQMRSAKIRAGFKNKEPKLQTAKEKKDRLAKITKDLAAIDTEGVWHMFPDNIVNGHYAGLKLLLKRGGLTFNKRAIEDFVSRELWHCG